MRLKLKISNFVQQAWVLWCHIWRHRGNMSRIFNAGEDVKGLQDWGILCVHFPFQSPSNIFQISQKI